MPIDPSPDFHFDGHLSTEANIEAFFRHLEESEPALADLLRDAAFELAQPMEDAERNRVRQRLNAAILRELDQAEAQR